MNNTAFYLIFWLVWKKCIFPPIRINAKLPGLRHEGRGIPICDVFDSIILKERYKNTSTVNVLLPALCKVLRKEKWNEVKRHKYQVKINIVKLTIIKWHNIYHRLGCLLFTQFRMIDTRRFKMNTWQKKERNLAMLCHVPIMIIEILLPQRIKREYRCSSITLTNPFLVRRQKHLSPPVDTCWINILPK